MSKPRRANKRLGKTKNINEKRQKLSYSDSGEEQKTIYPKTSTTRKVLEKFVNRVSERNGDNKTSNDDKYSPKNILTHSGTTIKFNKSGEDEPSKADKSSLLKISSPSNKTAKFKYTTSRTTQSKVKYQQQTTSNLEKYSPKNIKSPASIKSSPVRAIKIPYKPNLPSQNTPLALKVAPTCSYKNSTGISTLDSPLGFGVSSESHEHLVKLDIFGRNKYTWNNLKNTSVENVSAHSCDFLKNTDKKKCEQFEDEEMSLFFQKLLPYTVALSGEKRHELKTLVVNSLQQVIGGDLLELS